MAKTGNNGSPASTEDLGAQVETLRKDIAAIAGTLRQLVNQETETGKKRIKKRAAQLRERGYDAASEVRAQGDAMIDDAQTAISTNPFTAVLVAVGLGFLLGIMSRKS